MKEVKKMRGMVNGTEYFRIQMVNENGEGLRYKNTSLKFVLEVGEGKGFSTISSKQIEELTGLMESFAAGTIDKVGIKRIQRLGKCGKVNSVQAEERWAGLEAVVTEVNENENENETEDNMNEVNEVAGMEEACQGLRMKKAVIVGEGTTYNGLCDILRHVKNDCMTFYDLYEQMNDYAEESLTEAGVDIWNEEIPDFLLEEANRQISFVIDAFNAPLLLMRKKEEEAMRKEEEWKSFRKNIIIKDVAGTIISTTNCGATGCLMAGEDCRGCRSHQGLACEFVQKLHDGGGMGEAFSFGVEGGEQLEVSTYICF